jgi:proliferating cell nuclear antigen
MKLALENAKDFKKSIDGIAVLIDEAEFLVNEEGLTLKATDPSQISMVDFLLPKEAFKEFKIEEQVKLGVDVDYLRQIMGRAKDSDQVVLALNDEKTSLELQFLGTSRKKFRLPLIDVSQTEIPTPKIDFTAEVKLKAALFQDALKDAELVSSHVTLGATNQGFYVEASSSRGTMHNETPKEQLISSTISEEARVMFSLEYLSDMVKTASSDTELTLLLRSNAPIKIVYNVGNARLAYFLAPRMETE